MRAVDGCRGEGACRERCPVPLLRPPSTPRSWRHRTYVLNAESNIAISGAPGDPAHVPWLVLNRPSSLAGRPQPGRLGHSSWFKCSPLGRFLDQGGSCDGPLVTHGSKVQEQRQQQRGGGASMLPRRTVHVRGGGGAVTPQRPCAGCALPLPTVCTAVIIVAALHQRGLAPRPCGPKQASVEPRRELPSVKRLDREWQGPREESMGGGTRNESASQALCRWRGGGR